MASIETEIWLAIKSRIDSIPGGFDVAYPADVYHPTGGTAYLSVGRVTIPPRRVLVANGPHERTGSFTISHVAPIGQVQAVYEEAGGKIAAHFPEDLRMKYGAACVRVVSYPHVIDGYRDGAWWHTPVTIRWYCSG